MWSWRYMPKIWLCYRENGDFLNIEGSTLRCKSHCIKINVIPLCKVFDQICQETISQFLFSIFFDIFSDIFISTVDDNMTDFLKKMMHKVIPSVFMEISLEYVWYDTWMVSMTLSLSISSINGWHIIEKDFLIRLCGV